MADLKHKPKWWQRGLQAVAGSIYRGYDVYKQRTGGREIPVIVLMPPGIRGLCRTL